MPRMQFNSRISARNFGFQSDKTVLGFEPRHVPSSLARLPNIDPFHAFDVENFERMRMWWESTDTTSPLYISGPTGCGKTTTALQFLARLNAPVVSITCRRRMDKYELLGGWGVGSGGAFRWFDGPATLAWRYGFVLMINEFTVAPPEMWVSANDLLEGDDLVNDRTGETVPRHPNTRIIITDNCTCGFTGSSNYRSRNVQDLSVTDRFWHIAFDYLPFDTEKAMLKSKSVALTEGLSDSFVDSIITRATQFCVRTRNYSTTKNETPDLQPISTRVVLRFLSILFEWAKIRPDGIKDPIAWALELSLTAGCDPVTALTLDKIAHFEFADLDTLA